MTVAFLDNIADLLTLAEVPRADANQSTDAQLRTRIKHLLAEHDALRLSHAEATCAAIEQREERLRQQEEHFRQLKRLHLQNEMILNSAGEGIVSVDQDRRVVFVNPAAARMLGWEVEELVGRPLHEFTRSLSLDESLSPGQEHSTCQMLRGSAAPPTGEQVFWKKDGNSFPVEYTSTPIREGEQIGGLVVTFRDITERRMLEAQLRQAQKLESIGQLAAGIAHEINTPTQYIGDNTRFIEDAFRDLSVLLEACQRLGEAAGGESPPELVAELVGEMVAAAEQADTEYLLEEIPKAISQSLEGVQRVAKIVRSMKEFSHPGGEERQAVDFNRAIESTLTVCRNEWKYVAEAVTDFDSDLPLVSCLPADCNQVILNLIVNAAHAIADKVGKNGDEKGTITVRTRRDGDWVEIRVTDTGTGIPEEIRPKIFDPFFTTKAVGRGTGQGLAIVHSIVTEKHKGTIAFETETGCGTTFVVRLPIG